MIKNQSLNSFDYCLSCRIQITKTIRKQGELSYSCEILVFQGFYCLFTDKKLITYRVEPVKVLLEDVIIQIYLPRM